MPRSFVKLKFKDLALMENLSNITQTVIRRFLVISLIIALIVSQAQAQESDRPSSGAMMIDVPIRVLSLGLSVVSTAFFVVALPFTLTSGSTGEAWETLVEEPFEFTFFRPLGQFDDWKTVEKININKLRK